MINLTRLTFLAFLILGLATAHAGTYETWECANHETDKRTDWKTITATITIFNSQEWGIITINGDKYNTEVEFKDNGVRDFVFGELDKQRLYPFRFQMTKAGYAYYYKFKKKDKKGKIRTHESIFYCRQTS